MLLGLGLDVANKQPGIGWGVYAVAVVLLWVTFLIMEIAVVVRQLRSRIFDIETISTVILMLLSFALAAWYVHYDITA
jgi:dolichyl-phosphate-mannose--protein O-mannosyl transferase